MFMLTGACVAHWTHQECVCEGGIVASNCLNDFKAVSLTLEDNLIFEPGKKFIRAMVILEDKLKHRSLVPKSEKEFNERSLGISFRTVTKTGNIFQAISTDATST